MENTEPNTSTNDQWWKFDNADATESTEKEYRQSVVNYLEENGHHGYALGDTTICGYVLMNVCILDPHNDIPNDILMFADNVNDYMNNPTTKPLVKEDFDHSYDKLYESYNLVLHVNAPSKAKEFAGMCNKQGDIKNMREIS
ncbi:hypothetical protein KKA50_00870 [Patescibacteria group bacterium]|nr:hypothetical protein [Patescibacteria group bacterium]